MWFIICAILFVLGFYAGLKFRESGEYAGSSLVEIYEQLGEEDQKYFRSQCGKVLSNSRKTKCKNSTEFVGDCY